MNVLVLNAGSSSLKFQLIRTDAERIAADSDEYLGGGIIERIGGEAVMKVTVDGRTRKETAPIRDHRAAVDRVLRWIASSDSGIAIDSIREIEAVGHRVVHGGEQFQRSVLIDEQVIKKIEDTIDIAPLHNPHNLKGILAAREALGPGVPQAAVFDTAFHHTLPDYAYLYAIPYSLYRRYKLRRYGFHGTSHRYVAYRWRKLTGRTREQTRVITLHLGNGASMTAIREGVSVDTSMGFTPLEGLVMGTRSGDIDPAMLDYIAAKEGMSIRDLDLMLNKQSGLLGISGLTHDMRDLLAEAQEHDDRRARLAVEMFCYRAKKYLGAYLAVLGGAEAVIFTGGIGENAAEVRTRILSGMEWAGIEVDARANEKAVGKEGKISKKDSKVEVWVIPTNEELVIARDTARLVLGIEQPH